MDTTIQGGTQVYERRIDMPSSTLHWIAWLVVSVRLYHLCHVDCGDVIVSHSIARVGFRVDEFAPE